MQPCWRRITHGILFAAAGLCQTGLAGRFRSCTFAADREDEIQAQLTEEWQAVPLGSTPPDCEPVGGELVRFPLHAGQGTPEAVRLLARLLHATAQAHAADPDAFAAMLEQIAALPEPGIAAWIAEYRKRLSACGAQRGIPCGVSAALSQLRSDYAYYFPLLLVLQRAADAEKPALIAIDGCCGSGKTRLAALLAEVFPCRVFHTDDFYLPVARRTADWQSVPAGNMDLDRLRCEVLEPARQGADITFRAFDCRSQSLRAPQTVPFAPITVVEGSYALHPSLAGVYDRKIFLTCPADEQERRLRAREAAHYADFEAI